LEIAVSFGRRAFDSNDERTFGALKLSALAASRRGVGWDAEPEMSADACQHQATISQRSA
jgi:hypothetical protein